MHPHPSLEVADDSTSGLLQWGIGGGILAALVAPVLFGFMANWREREKVRLEIEKAEQEARTRREEKDAELRSQREGKLVDALVASVEQQKQALEQWRRFEESEEKTHEAILTGLAQATQTLARIAERLAEHQQTSATTAAAQTQIAQLLGDVATQIQTLKRTP
ncbi:MAG: hypothetical protein JNK15_23750 [Planctomycetes bacterium]|nr:hypothetical protein [Planctomycetota bacterium]